MDGGLDMEDELDEGLARSLSPVAMQTAKHRLTDTHAHTYVHETLEPDGCGYVKVNTGKFRNEKSITILYIKNLFKI